jgi:hypothetical protein
VKSDDCPREEEVRRAASSNSLDEALHAHVAVCAACRETALVSGFLARLAAASPSEAALPDPGRILQRARFLDKLMREQALIERATRPVLVAEAVFQAALVGAVIWLGVFGMLGATLSTSRWLADPLGAWTRLSSLLLSCSVAAGLAFLLSWRVLGRMSE